MCSATSLDNCHVRVAFATNDERTAKRISDALGTATELRAQRNYAGHRLSPWLGHVMISRQETPRQLLTPGEIMQLPPNDEIVMVSGHWPVRAQKVRYYEDLNFVSRVLPPPVLGQDGYLDRPEARRDDWTELAAPALHCPVPPPSLAPAPSLADTGGGIAPEDSLTRVWVDPAAQSETPEESEALDRQLVPDDFDDTNDEFLRREQFTRAARLATLDPEDGIPL